MTRPARKQGDRPGEDWDFFAGFNAITEAYRTLKRVADKGQVARADCVEFGRRLLRITDQAQLVLMGEVDRSSVAHARCRIALHHVLEWTVAANPVTPDLDRWEAKCLEQVASLLAMANEILVDPEELGR